MIQITLYSKQNCHLCDEMKLVLEKIKENVNFDLNLINIDADKNLYEKYSEKIPVLFFNNKIFAKYKVDEAKLLKKLISESKTH